MKQYFSVMTISKNSWNTDGTPIIENECGHKHRTISGAYKCLRNLTKSDSSGMSSAKWYHAKIRHFDGSKFADAENNAVIELEYNA